MPSYAINYLAKWRNYHLTAAGTYGPAQPPSDAAATVRELAELHAADVGGLAGKAMFAGAAQPLQALLRQLDRRLDVPVHPLRRQPYPASCGLMGQGWSFSDIVAAGDLLVDLDGLAGIAPVDAADLHPASCLSPPRLAMVLGGTRLREIVNWGAPRGLSLLTSGTHLGPTIAGSAATSSHGSRLGAGGVQNLIRGMHMVVGGERSVWIEPASAPVFSDAAARQFADAVERDDQLFNDALVHLGAMGIVNGVVMDMVPDDQFLWRFGFNRPTPDWLDDMAAGRFAKIAADHGLAGDPAFYEVTINPFAWDRSEAIHSFYMPITAVAAEIPSAGCPVERDFIASAVKQFGAAHAPNVSIFDLYRAEVEARIVSGDLDAPRTWGELHEDVITGGLPGALWNASFAMPRERLPEVIPIICAASHGCMPTFLYTIRFVSNAAGTLAFTRWPETAIIEIDGASAYAPGGLGQYGGEIVKGCRQLRAALDAGAVPYMMHWAKLGDLDAPCVAANFGHASDPHSAVAQWRRSRDRLLGSARMQGLFWNEAVVRYGLLDRPPPPPPPPKLPGEA